MSYILSREILSDNEYLQLSNNEQNDSENHVIIGQSSKYVNFSYLDGKYVNYNDLYDQFIVKLSYVAGIDIDKESIINNVSQQLNDKLVELQNVTTNILNELKFYKKQFDDSYLSDEEFYNIYKNYHEEFQQKISMLQIIIDNNFNISYEDSNIRDIISVISDNPLFEIPDIFYDQNRYDTYVDLPEFDLYDPSIYNSTQVEFNEFHPYVKSANKIYSQIKTDILYKSSDIESLYYNFLYDLKNTYRDYPINHKYDICLIKKPDLSDAYFQDHESYNIGLVDTENPDGEVAGLITILDDSSGHSQAYTYSYDLNTHKGIKGIASANQPYIKKIDWVSLRESYYGDLVKLNSLYIQDYELHKLKNKQITLNIVNSYINDKFNDAHESNYINAISYVNDIIQPYEDDFKGTKYFIDGLNNKFNDYVKSTSINASISYIYSYSDDNFQVYVDKPELLYSKTPVKYIDTNCIQYKYQGQTHKLTDLNIPITCRIVTENNIKRYLNFTATQIFDNYFKITPDNRNSVSKTIYCNVKLIWRWPKTLEYAIYRNKKHSLTFRNIPIQSIYLKKVYVEFGLSSKNESIDVSQYNYYHNLYTPSTTVYVCVNIIFENMYSGYELEHKYMCRIIENREDVRVIFYPNNTNKQSDIEPQILEFESRSYQDMYKSQFICKLTFDEKISKLSGYIDVIYLKRGGNRFDEIYSLYSSDKENIVKDLNNNIVGIKLCKKHNIDIYYNPNMNQLKLRQQTLD